MPRDVATTKYVRWRLLNWRDEDKNLLTPLQIEKICGAKASAISQIRAGKLGVGPAVIAPLARAWKVTEGQLLDTAREWYANEGKDADDVVDAAVEEPALAEAIEVVRSLGRLTEEQIRAIVAGFGAPYFRGRDREWWITTLLSEAEQLRKSQAAQLATERTEKRKQATHRKLVRELEAERARPPSHPPKANRRAG
jgi:hypothetical protein